MDRYELSKLESVTHAKSPIILAKFESLRAKTYGLIGLGPGLELMRDAFHDSHVHRGA